MKTRMRTICAGVATLLLAACGTSDRPQASARAPIPVPPYVVSIPLPSVRPRGPDTAPVLLRQQVEAMVRGFAGKAGVAIRAVDEGWTVESGGRQRLPQQSVSKLWVAITVMDQRDKGRIRLDQPVDVTPSDLTLFHQPIAGLVTRSGVYRTTVANLLLRAMTQSDNTANDRLLSLVGGPAAVRAMIADKQLGDIRFGPGERLLQAGTAGVTWSQSMSTGGGFEAARRQVDPNLRAAALSAYIAEPPDGAAPIAIADSLGRLARGELLSETSTRLLLTTMGQSVTGRARLRAGLAPGWQIAHKTGTGQELGRRNAGFNDVGLLTAPDGKRYAVAVMIGDTMQPMRVRQQLISGVAAALTGYRGAVAVGGETEATN